jgi:hypothetical protein
MEPSQRDWLSFFAEPRPTSVQVASAASNSGSIGTFFGNLFGFV